MYKEMRSSDRKYSRYRLPQKKNPFNKVETWKKPWKAKNYVYKGIKIFN